MNTKHTLGSFGLAALLAASGCGDSNPSEPVTTLPGVEAPRTGDPATMPPLDGYSLRDLYFASHIFGNTAGAAYKNPLPITLLREGVQLDDQARLDLPGYASIDEYSRRLPRAAYFSLDDLQRLLYDGRFPNEKPAELLRRMTSLFTPAAVAHLGLDPNDIISQQKADALTAGIFRAIFFNESEHGLRFDRDYPLVASRTSQHGEPLLAIPLSHDGNKRVLVTGAYQRTVSGVVMPPQGMEGYGKELVRFYLAETGKGF